MQTGFKFKNCGGFGKLYDYAYKYNHMITDHVKD